MKTLFLSYCKENNLIKDGQKTLIAISGGADSVVLSHLFHSCKLPFALAHCNFKLRGANSDADETFVRKLALKYDCQFYIKSFNTTQFANQNKLSIEMAARQLRYQWFESIRLEHGYDFVATAHHQEDNAETVMLNIIRGTGLRGLIGIKNKTQHIIRPMLFADKAMILDYVKKQNLSFRTDESNNELIYKRNKLRNIVFPILKELNPSVVKTLNENAGRISQSFDFYEQKLNEILSNIVKQPTEEVQTIAIAALQNTGFTELLLFEWLRPYGFTEDVLQNVYEVLSAQSGKRFIAGEYELLKDREMLVLSKTASVIPPVTIEDDTKQIDFPIHLRIEKRSISEVEYKNIPHSVAVFDAKRIAFPLTVRQWQDGDWFIPLGMNQRKKLSDFFIDKKVPLHEKNNTLVLVDKNGEILWVIGHRISDNVKVTEKTIDVFRMIND